ncbi:MAG: hypothetical protein QW141_05310 [Ignisphaera sp.]
MIITEVMNSTVKAVASLAKMPYTIISIDVLKAINTQIVNAIPLFLKPTMRKAVMSCAIFPLSDNNVANIARDESTIETVLDITSL